MFAPNGEDYLNEVRARAYGDNSQDYTPSEGTLLDAIYTERRKELAGEGHRLSSLRHLIRHFVLQLQLP